MKLIVILIAVSLFFIAPAFSDLTPDDINMLRLVIKEEVEKVVAASETRTKEYVSQEIKTVNVTISEMDKRLTGKIDTLSKRLDNLFLLMLALVGFIAVVIGIPQILVVLQRKEVRAQNEKLEVQQRQMEAQQKQLEAQQEQIKTLQRQLEALPQERVVGP